MALQPFTWGQGGQALTPAQAKARREAAAALMAQNAPATTFGGGLAKIGDALRGMAYDNQAQEAETAGAAQRKAVIDALMANPNAGMADLVGAMSDPWVSSDPGSAAVVQALLAQEMQKNDPLRQLQLQAAQQGVEKGGIELDALKNPAPPAPEYGFTIAPDGTMVRTDKTSGGIEPVGNFAPAPAPEYGFTMAPDGTMVRTDKAGGEIEPMGNFAAPEKPIAVGDALIDPATMQPLYQAPPDPTGNMKDYDAYAADEVKAGRQPLGRLEYEQAVRSSGATSINNTIGGEGLTPGWKKVDETFATDYLDWTQGGWADAKKQMEQLGESIDLLGKGGNITGAVGLLPSQLQAFFNPDGTIAQENVAEVVQRSLRAILGAQFTENEGVRLIARAFNPLLPPEENAKRVKRLLRTIQGMAESKQGMVDYFDQNGTLRGYKGPRFDPTAVGRLADDFGEAPGEATAGGNAIDDPQQSQANPDIVDFSVYFR